MTEDYLDINRNSWNKRTLVHYNSNFYDNASFIKGRNSLNDIELPLLGDLHNKKVLHLQCHFGQDTISLARMGATVTGVDFSDVAIRKANELAAITQEEAHFICCDLYRLPEHLNDQFDIVFSSYGTIGWLPDVDLWASIVSRYLKPGGSFVFAEFHPFVWMFDDHFKQLKYSYFNTEEILEEKEASYTDGDLSSRINEVSWNHNLGEVFTALLHHGLELSYFEEFNYSPYNCFKDTYEAEPRKFRIRHLKDKIPMVYALKAIKRS